MTSPDSEKSLRWLLVDFNAYFASVEQQERPELRAKPVAVVPSLVDTTCAIAASYEAKAFGIKQGAHIRPFGVGVAVFELAEDAHHTLSLFAEDRRAGLSHAIDRINEKYGRDSAYFGGVHEALFTNARFTFLE